MKFALSKNQSLRAHVTKKVKTFHHIECGGDLLPTKEDGIFYCPSCVKSGFLVKKDSP